MKSKIRQGFKLTAISTYQGKIWNVDIFSTDDVETAVHTKERRITSRWHRVKRHNKHSLTGKLKNMCIQCFVVRVSSSEMYYYTNRPSIIFPVSASIQNAVKKCHLLFYPTNFICYAIMTLPKRSKTQPITLQLLRLTKSNKTNNSSQKVKIKVTKGHIQIFVLQP